MRVGIIALQHESNTFIGTPTTLDDFRRKTLLIGDQIIARFRGGHHEISGLIEGLENAKADVVPIFAAAATPGGALDALTYEALLRMMFEQVDHAGKLDGVFVAPHGAGVSESDPDMDGHWLSRVREAVGRQIPIVGTLDPHANLSERMLKVTDALITYRSNPHLDQKARGIEAAQLLIRVARGETGVCHAGALPPVCINIERQLTSASPCRELYALADKILSRPGVLSDSVILGFPYADVAEMGSGLIVVTDGDRSLAQKCANELADYLIEHRHEFVGDLIDVENAIDLAMRSPAPVCLLDMGDNIGGGSPGDGSVVARALHERRIDRCFVSLFDPQAVEQAADAGVGATIETGVGGKSVAATPASPAVTLAGNAATQASQLHVRATVVSIHDGTFTETEARHGGMSHHDMGKTAIVRSEHGMMIQLTSRRTPPFSLGQITSCGIDPRSLRIIVAKGVHAPVAAYSPVCPTLIRVNTPGVTCADMTRLSFKNRRRPLFPFEDEGIDTWSRPLPSA